ncbi:hypothetical protein ACVBEJ_14115 [Porticoccus sp. GXU_MW_L64]
MKRVYNPVSFLSLIAIVLSMILVADPVVHALTIIAAGAVGLFSVIKGHYVPKKLHNGWLNLGIFLVSALLIGGVYFVARLIGS